MFHQNTVKLLFLENGVKTYIKMSVTFLHTRVKENETYNKKKLEIVINISMVH